MAKKPPVSYRMDSLKLKKKKESPSVYSVGEKEILF